VVHGVLSSDGTQILLGLNPTYLTDVESGEILQTFQGEFRRIVFTVDGTRVVGTDPAAGATVVFDIETGTELIRLVGHKAGLWMSSIDLAGERLVTSAADGAIVWDIASPVRGDLESMTLDPSSTRGFFPRSLDRSDEHVLVRRGEYFSGLASVEDQSHQDVEIVRIDDGHTVYRSAAWTAALIGDGTLFEQPVLDTDAVTPSGLTGAIHVGAPRVVDLATGEVVRTMDGCDWYWIGPYVWPELGGGCDGLIAQYRSVQAASDGSVLAYKDPTGADLLYQSGTIWDTGSGSSVEVPRAIALSPDGTFLIELGETDSDFVVIDQTTGAEIAGFATDFPVSQLRFDTDSGLLVGAVDGSTLMVVDPETWQVTTLAGTVGGALVDMDGSPDGTRVATVRSGGVIVVWDVASGGVEAEIPVHGLGGGGLSGIVFLDDETILVAPESGTHMLRFSLNAEVVRQRALDGLNRGFLDEECITYDIDPCPTLAEMLGER
jgi:WD40 repeat protein